MHSPQEHGNSGFFVICGLWLLSLIIKLRVSTDLKLIITSSLYDLALYCLIYFLFSYLLPKRAIVRVLFYILIFIHTVIILSYSYFLDEFFARGYSLQSFSLEKALIFFTDIFPVHAILIMTAMASIVVWAASKIALSVRGAYIYTAAAASVVVVVAMPLLSEFSHPYINTLRAGIANNNTIAIRDVEVNPEVFNNELERYNLGQLKYKKVFLFIMEEIALDTLQADSKKTPVGKNYFNITTDNTHSYGNYFASSQESRTGIMSMLSSIFIPYEGYSHSDWKTLYAQKVLARNNVVDYFNHNGYETYFLVSSIETTAGIGDYAWDSIVNLSLEDFNNSSYVCLHIFQNQRGCEDKILADDLQTIALKDEKAFVMMEFVYGHGSEYSNKLGLTRTEYYNEFLFDFHEFLKDEGLLEDSLIIVTSDHGHKGTFFENDIESYRIPLLVYSPSIEKEEHAALFSQLDFADIIISHTTDVYLPRMDNEYVFIMGSTGTHFVSYYESDGDYATAYRFSTPRVHKTNVTDPEQISRRISEFVKYKEEF